MTNDDSTPFALVVDDEVLIRMSAESILEEAGFRVYEAAGTAAALALLEHVWESVQLLFTDVHMPPGRDGFALARECATRWPHIGILVASSLSTVRPGDLPRGAVFIQKPFSADVVYQHLQAILPDGRKPEPLKRLTERQRY